MKLSIKALAVTAAVFWGGAVLLVGIGHVLFPPYGAAFLEMAASIYPGYQVAPTAGSVITGTGYAVVDGAVCGAIFGWIYNLVAG